MIFARRAMKGKRELSAIEKIEAAECPLVTVPWKGSPCVVKGRELTDLQIQAIGNFSLIETDEFRWSQAPQRKVAWSELLAYARQNLAICRAWLVSPSYEDIFRVVGQHGFNAEVRSRVEKINEQLNTMSPGPARQELEEIRDSLILAWEVILPSDFMSAIVAYALGTHKSDIKKITEEMLYQAAILAERGKKAPHEYIHGVFSDFNIRDIDTQAWIVYERHMAELREEAQRKKGA